MSLASRGSLAFTGMQMPPAGAKLRAAKIFTADSEEFEIPAVTSVSRQQITTITQAEALHATCAESDHDAVSVPAAPYYC